MRLSMVAGDKNTAERPQDYIVTLDGVKQTVCLIADEEKGFIRRYKKNQFGLLIKGREGVITEDLKGVVVITKKEGL